MIYTCVVYVCVTIPVINVIKYMYIYTCMIYSCAYGGFSFLTYYSCFVFESPCFICVSQPD